MTIDHKIFPLFSSSLLYVASYVVSYIFVVHKARISNEFRLKVLEVNSLEKVILSLFLAYFPLIFFVFDSRKKKVIFTFSQKFTGQMQVIHKLFSISRPFFALFIFHFSRDLRKFLSFSTK
jgi:hypothetical protein